MPHHVTRSGVIFFYDVEDHELIQSRSWHVAKTGRKFYVCGPSGEYLHRLILGLEVGDERMGDHGNGCTMDNRRKNLEAVTAKQNAWNVRNTKANQTGFEGVSKIKDRYQARIYIDGIRRSLGYFDTPEQAASAYAEKQASLQRAILGAAHG